LFDFANTYKTTCHSFRLFDIKPKHLFKISKT